MKLSRTVGGHGSAFSAEILKIVLGTESITQIRATASLQELSMGLVELRMTKAKKE